MYMTRTQVYLPEDMLAYLHFLAENKQTSSAELIRRYVQSGIESEKKAQKKKGNPLSSLIGFAKSKGPKDISSHFDHYLYDP